MSGDGTRPVLWCATASCRTQIAGYGFTDRANPPTSITGPWFCVHCARRLHRVRPGDIEQAFTSEPVKPGSKWSFS